MKQIYNIFCGLLALLLLLCGCISVFDKDASASVVQDRELKTFPEFQIGSFLKGSFGKELDLYYADTFPGREHILEGDWIVSNFFDFSNLHLEETE